MTLRECRPFRRSDLIGFIRIDGVYHAIQEWTVRADLGNGFSPRPDAKSYISLPGVETFATCCGMSMDEYPPGREVYDPGDQPRENECAECLRIAAARFEQSVGYKP